MGCILLRRDLSCAAKFAKVLTRLSFSLPIGVTSILVYATPEDTCSVLFRNLCSTPPLGIRLAQRMQIPLSSRSLICLHTASKTGFRFFQKTTCTRLAPLTGFNPRLILSLRRAIQTIGMVDCDPDEPDAKRSRLDLEGGVSQDSAQPLRERTVVAPPPSTSKALKSVLKGTHVRLTQQRQALQAYTALPKLKQEML